MKHDQLVIIGAGGHGRVVADVAKDNGYKEILFLDDAENVDAVGKVADYAKYIENSDFFVAIGNYAIRGRIQKMIEDQAGEIATLIHSNAVLGSNIDIGKGTVVMAGTVINAGAVIGEGAIINTCSSVDHDCVIGDYCHISVGAHLAGTVAVGKGTMIGAGATVINNINICEGCVIGAGAVVVRSIKTSGTYVGVPAILQ